MIECMDAEGYPEESELRKIKKWDWHDAMGLIDYIEGRWNYRDWGFKKKWAKDELLKRSWVLHIELHTFGWSGNESLIDALLQNRMMLVALNYRMWKAGGHYWFEFNPIRNGYKLISEIAKENNVSRQSIHKSNKYIFLKAGDKTFAKQLNQ